MLDVKQGDRVLTCASSKTHIVLAVYSVGEEIVRLCTPRGEPFWTRRGNIVQILPRDQ